jgi:hypothetical protein
MKASFYDVKARTKVETDVTEKKEYTVNGGTRYAIKGKTADGRTLTKFVSKTDYDNTTV